MRPNAKGTTGLSYNRPLPAPARHRSVWIIWISPGIFSPMPAPTPRDSASEPLIAATAQTLIAGAVAACLAAAAAWLTLAGGFSGRLVDHKAPPAATARFTVNVNAASAVELAQLPGLGPAMAQRIVDHRIAHGDFPSLDALLDVPGVGEATLAAIRPHLRPIKPPSPSPAGAD